MDGVQLVLLGEVLILPRSGARAALFGSVAAFAVVAGVIGCAKPAGQPQPRATIDAEISMERFTVSEYSGGTIRRRLRAERAIVLPKHAGILQVNPLRELVLSGVEIELFLDAGHPAGERPGFEALEHGALAIARGGHRVVGAAIRGLEGTIRLGGEVVIRLAAERGSLDPRSGELELRNVKLEHRRAARTFLASSAHWGRDAIEIPGLFQMEETGRVTEGRRLRVAFDGATAPQ